MGLAETKKELTKLTKGELIELISELYKKEKTAKEFFDFSVDPNEKALFEKYREKMYAAFNPKKGRHSLMAAKQVINDFKKLKPSKEYLADLMLFYVETGIALANELDDLNESFYLSIEKAYVAALTFMQNANILREFETRAKQLIADSEEIYWDMQYFLEQTYEEFYPNSNNVIELV